MSLYSFRNLLTAQDIEKSDLEQLQKLADQFKSARENGESAPLQLEDKILAALFLEPSTRTRLSTETAMLRLGGRVINVIDQNSTSIKKGETLHDTGKMVSQYADIIAMRHAEAGTVADLAEGSDVPVINCGDGPAEHPTQSLVDFYTIVSEKGRINGLKIALVGDLKFGRTVHSLVTVLRHFDVSYSFVAPEALQMPDKYCRFLDELGVKYTKTEALQTGIADADVIYDTRIQSERFASAEEYAKYKGVYVFTPEILRQVPEAILMHPLPRIDEITKECDAEPNAKYFTQVKNSVFVRMALIYGMLTN